jgi:hypothetical protein
MRKEGLTAGAGYGATSLLSDGRYFDAQRRDGAHRHAARFKVRKRVRIIFVCIVVVFRRAHSSYAISGALSITGAG